MDPIRLITFTLAAGLLFVANYFLMPSTALALPNIWFHATHGALALAISIFAELCLRKYLRIRCEWGQPNPAMRRQFYLQIGMWCVFAFISLHALVTPATIGQIGSYSIITCLFASALVTTFNLLTSEDRS
jgi:hypothetical protein